MDDLNTVALVGRLTADPELRSTRSGTDVCSFRLAFNTSKKTDNGWEDQSNFINVTVWGKHGESVSRYTSKGSQVAVKGRLEYREWEGEGGRRSVIEVIAERVQFVGGKSDDDGGSRSSSSRSTGSSRSQRSTPADDDDIPF